jgi:hypothetical protein
MAGTLVAAMALSEVQKFVTQEQARRKVRKASDGWPACSETAALPLRERLSGETSRHHFTFSGDR